MVPRRPVIRAPTAEPTAAIRPGAAARRPISDTSAGSSVAAASTDTATTRIAPSAIERSAVASISHRPPSDRITVMPEKATATPDVAIARVRAASRLAPARTSSR